MNFLLSFRDEDTTVQNGFVRQRAAGSKSNIISSFLEDCLSVDDDSEVSGKFWENIPNYWNINNIINLT